MSMASRITFAGVLLAGLALPVSAQVVVATGGVLRVLDRLTGAVTDYDLEPGQKQAQGRLTLRLDECRYPADAAGQLVPHALAAGELEHYQGVLGHYHIQTNKNDPGPAFDWERVIGGARKILNQNSAPLLSPRAAGNRSPSSPGYSGGATKKSTTP